VPIPLSEARRIRSQREFDDRIVAVRHGFAGVEDYYRRASVGPLLDRLRVPALMVVAEDDPIVPAASLRRYLDPPPPALTPRWTKGGHVAFPARLDLGEPAPPGLESQVVSWLRRAAES
jgi:predicted alpha/beta-fold hydrolase